MEANQTEHESRGQQPQQPRQPPQYDATMSTGNEVTATIIAGGLRHCDHIFVHRPPPAQPASSSHLHQRAPKKKYRAVIKDSDEEQQKDADTGRESLWNGTNARNVYVAIRENNPTTGLPNQAHAARSPPYPGQPQGREIPKADDHNRQQQPGMQSGNTDHDLLLRKWRELAERKESHEAETTSVLKAFEAPYLNRTGFHILRIPCLGIPDPKRWIARNPQKQIKPAARASRCRESGRLVHITLGGVKQKSIDPWVERGNLRGWDDRRARSVPRITNISSQNSANKDGDWIRIKWRSH